MTPEQLIAEGRKLMRPCVFLKPQPTGLIAGVWYEPDDAEISTTGHRCVLTVDANRIPGLPARISGFATVFTDENTCEGGRVEIGGSSPKRSGTKLYAHPAEVLPPIDAVFARGSEEVGNWLKANNWARSEPFNDGFPDAKVVHAYERVFTSEYPIYRTDDVFAAAGGWHFSWPDGDWRERLEDRLMILTIRDAEPWVEAWQLPTGGFRVIQRVT